MKKQLLKKLQTFEWSPKEAVALQRELRDTVQIRKLEKPIRWIGGADISFAIGSDRLFAGIVILEAESMELAAYAAMEQRVPFPYVPGLLSFREVPPLFEAWKQLPLQPDVIMLDGHGIAHPRRLGVASHFGLLTGTPAIGCAKKILCGHYEMPAEEQGSWSAIQADEEQIGYALRTRSRVKPIFVSPGHLLGMEQSRELALHCARGYRLPEPTRQAHLLVNRFRRGELESLIWKNEAY